MPLGDITNTTTSKDAQEPVQNGLRMPSKASDNPAKRHCTGKNKNRRKYSKCPEISYTKVSDIMAYANSADPDQIALHSSPFH